MTTAKRRFPFSLVLGSSILGLFIIIGFVVSFLAPDDPTVWQTVPRNRDPSWQYLLGTTSQGQDIFWLLTWSVRNTLLLGIGVALVATVIGVLVGLAAGYIGGWFDRIASFLIDAMIAIPILPVLILVASILRGQTSLFVIGVALVAFNWPFPARQIRAVALSLREREFVHVAWFSGDSRFRIICYQFFPYLRSWSLANFVNTVLVATIIESSIAVIGLSSGNQATVGTMMFWAIEFQALLAGHWWWIGSPVAAIVLLFVGLFLTSSSITDLMATARRPDQA